MQLSLAYRLLQQGQLERAAIAELTGLTLAELDSLQADCAQLET